MNKKKAGQPRDEAARETNRISPEMRERIRSQIMKGKSKLEIVEELGLSYEVIRNANRRRNGK